MDPPGLKHFSPVVIGKIGHETLRVDGVADQYIKATKSTSGLKSTSSMTLHWGIRYATPDRIISPKEKKRMMVIVMRADFDGSVHSIPVQEHEK